MASPAPRSFGWLRPHRQFTTTVFARRLFGVSTSKE
jgi:hypothetical protein